MSTYVFRQLASGNTKLSKILNFQEVGSIIGRTKNTDHFIYNIKVDEDVRRQKNGSELLNIYETMIKYNYNINKVHLAAWEKISDPNSVKQFYIFNGYIKDNNILPIHFDDKVDFFEINQYFKIL
jgi:ribosomal protein S18 acetylase RimI-like enzyme